MKPNGLLNVVSIILIVISVIGIVLGLVVSILGGAVLDSRRIDAVSEPYPERWTHHVLVASAEEIDDELMAWVRETALFADMK